MEDLFDLHRALAWFLILSNAFVGCWALAAHWAEPLREELRENAERLAAEAGLKIVFIRKLKAFRKEARIKEILAGGTVTAGMLPKLEACVAAIEAGVERVHILDGRIAHVLLLEIFTDSGIGTMIRGAQEGSS